MLTKFTVLSLLILYLFSQAFAADSTTTSSTATSSTTQPPRFPQAVINEMAKRETRYHHYMWHNIRDKWLKLSATTQDRLRKLGWEPPRPSRSYDAAGNAIANVDNDSGEDFLYMHRRMIAKANAIIAQTNDSYGPIKGWASLPLPGDKDWPVPLEYIVPNNTGTTQFIKNVKTDSFFNRSIAAAEKSFKDPAQLRNMTLGQLGANIELTIHQWMHLRYSIQSAVGYRPPANVTLVDIEDVWDDPKYDWLGDTYSSQVSPVFWKIHGWVNDRIEDWRRANGLQTITWKGTWVGGPIGNLPNVNKSSTGSTRLLLSIPLITRSITTVVENLLPLTVHGIGETLSEVAVLFATSGVEESSFADKVEINTDFIYKI